MGKSYVIQQQARQCKATYIRVPFNGDEVDLDFYEAILELSFIYRELKHLEKSLLWMLQMRQIRKRVMLILSIQRKGKRLSGHIAAKNKDVGKILYHLDISACAGEDLLIICYSICYFCDISILQIRSVSLSMII